MSVFPIVITVIVYRILVIVLGFFVALYGMSKFRGSRAKTGEIEAQYDDAKVKIRNMPAGIFFVLLGIGSIIAGFCRTPKVTTEERDKEGNVRIIKVEQLPPIKHVEPEDVSISDLLANSEKYSDKMVRAKGRVVGWFMRGGGDERYMIVTLEENDSKIKVFSSKVKFFARDREEEVIVTGKFVVEGDKKGMDASPNVGGKIERMNGGEEKKE